ncbi:hypothetical protein ACFE04_027433 [Oxalis oulophora]
MANPRSPVVKLCGLFTRLEVSYEVDIFNNRVPPTKESALALQTDFQYLVYSADSKKAIRRKIKRNWKALRKIIINKLYGSEDDSSSVGSVAGVSMYEESSGDNFTKKFCSLFNSLRISRRNSQAAGSFSNRLAMEDFLIDDTESVDGLLNPQIGSPDSESSNWTSHVAGVSSYDHVDGVGDITDAGDNFSLLSDENNMS